MIPPSSPRSAEARRARNRQHWERTLDARNLSEEATPVALEDQLRLFRSADIEAALTALAPLDGRWVLDLGGGLGLMAILLARGGAEVLVVDVSLPRLRAARELARQAGVGARVRFILAEAEALPLRDGALDRQTTKSVLIHTQLPAAAAELARSLDPRAGTAVFVEPMDANPFVNAYRRLLAPRIWKEITDYFTPERFALLREPFEERGFRAEFVPLHFLGFFASAFHYLVPLPALAARAERFLAGVDRWLFRRLPRLSRRAWFGIQVLRGGGEGPP